MVMQEMLLALQETTRTPTLLRPHPERSAAMVKSREARMELQLQAVVAVALPTPSGCVFGQSNLDFGSKHASRLWTRNPCVNLHGQGLGGCFYAGIEAKRFDRKRELQRQELKVRGIEPRKARRADAHE